MKKRDLYKHLKQVLCVGKINIYKRMNIKKIVFKNYYAEKMENL